MMTMGGPFTGPIPPQQQQFDPSKINPLALQYAQMLFPQMNPAQAVSIVGGGQNGLPLGGRQLVDNGMFQGGPI